MSDERRRKSLDGVARSRSTERWRATSGWSTTVTPVMRGDAIACARDDGAQPQRRAQGARPRSRRARSSARSPRARRTAACCASATPTSPSPHGRLKLREEEPGGATLIAYERPDAASERVSSYRLVPVADPEPLRAALAAAAGVTRSSSSAAACCCGRRCGSTSTRCAGSASFLELEAVAEPGSDLSRERAQVARLRELLEIRDDALREGSYADALARRARRARRRSCSRWRARRSGGRTRRTRTSPSAPPLRTTDGRRYAGANVENAAYPQGQCAEASAIGALVAGGGGRIAEVVVAAPSHELCTPCGGCRQRLREFMRRRRADPPRRPRARAPHDDAARAAAAVLRAGAPGRDDRRGRGDRRARAAACAPRLGLMLGSGLGELADRLEDRVQIPYGELPGFHVGGLAGHAGALVLGPARGPAGRDLLGPLARLRGDRGERDHDADPHAQGARRRDARAHERRRLAAAGGRAGQPRVPRRTTSTCSASTR